MCAGTAVDDVEAAIFMLRQPDRGISLGDVGTLKLAPRDSRRVGPERLGRIKIQPLV